MSDLLALTAPLLLALGLGLALLRGVDGYRALTEGARKGLGVMLDVFPALLVLFPAIALLRASPLLSLLEGWLSPLLGAAPAAAALLGQRRPRRGGGAHRALRPRLSDGPHRRRDARLE